MVGEDKKPEIRFAGFTNAWEQRKLGNYIETSSEKNVSNEYTKEDVLSVSGDYGIVNQIEFQGRSFAGVSVSNYGIVNHGDIVYTKSPLKFNPYGIIKTNKGKAGIVSTLYAVYKAKSYTNPDFVQCYFEQDYRLNKYLKPLVNKGAKNDMKVSADNALLGQVTFPSFNEQKKISELFKHLDHLITLHQRKYDKLVIVKKSMLEKMFPKDGDNVPEIRFAGFADAWERRKLSEVAKYRNGKAHENDISEKGKYVVVNSKFVSTDGEVRKYSEKQIEPLYKNEIAFVLSDVPNGRAIARTFLIEKEDKYTLNQRIAGITPFENVYPYFLHILMNRNRYFLQFDDGAKQTNLSVDDVMKFEDFYPSEKEQQKIGEYFNHLDHIITLHQCELEKLKNIKQSLLEKMF